MGSSGGGGSGRASGQPTPSGPIADFGSSTDFNPGFTNVLGAGWATPESIDAGLAAGPQYRTPPPPPPMPGGGPGGGMASMEAFAKQVLDYNKQQQLGNIMMGFGPKGFAQGIQALRAPAPVAQGPAQQ